MADQSKCQRAMEEVAQAVNGMFSYRRPATAEEAEATAEEVASRIRAELATKDAGEEYYCGLCRCMMPLSHFPH